MRGMALRSAVVLGRIGALLAVVALTFAVAGDLLSRETPRTGADISQLGILTASLCGSILASVSLWCVKVRDVNQLKSDE